MSTTDSHDNNKYHDEIGNRGSGSTTKRKQARHRAQGEFVWVTDGAFGQHPAQLVIHTNDNPPHELDDTELVEVRYTTSGKYDWIENQHIEYPNKFASQFEMGNGRNRTSRTSKWDDHDTPEKVSQTSSVGGDSDKSHLKYASDQDEDDYVEGNRPARRARSIRSYDYVKRRPRQKKVMVMENSTSDQDEHDCVEGKRPARKARSIQSYDYVKRRPRQKKVVAVDEEKGAGAINEGEVSSKKRSFADVTGYYGENPPSKHERKFLLRTRVNHKGVEDTNKEENKPIERFKSDAGIQGVGKDEDDQQREVEEPPTKRPRVNGVDGEMFSTLTSLADPLINVGRFIFNGLFGKK
jgi:hypothetical protein